MYKHEFFYISTNLEKLIVIVFGIMTSMHYVLGRGWSLKMSLSQGQMQEDLQEDNAEQESDDQYNILGTARAQDEDDEEDRNTPPCTPMHV